MILFEGRLLVQKSWENVYFLNTFGSVKGKNDAVGGKEINIQQNTATAGTGYFLKTGDPNLREPKFQDFGGNHVTNCIPGYAPFYRGNP